MNISRKFGYFILPLLSILLLSQLATATELQCKVVEVHSGDTISVVNGSGPMKVRLKAVAAPDMEQPLGDVARQHLSDLVLGKTVMVRLTGLSTDRNIVGVVYLNKADIGQQMLRDGVAWYDRSNDSGLDEQERYLYLGSEQAARQERRGIWQSDSPVPPWEFRHAKAAQATAAPAVAGNNQPKPASEASVRTPKMTSTPRLSTSGWQSFAPDGEEFSMLIPPVKVESPPKTVKGWTYYRAIDDNIAYQVFKGPNIEGRDPAEVFNDMMDFQTTLHDVSRKHGVSADIYPQRDLPPLNGYTGKQYELYLNSIHSVMRLYVSRRSIYAFGVVGGYEGDPRVDKFLASFKLGKEASKSMTQHKAAK
jgi:endonuclease YncB( thermonuclease family)